MKVHHLNCATLCPWGGSLIDGNPGLMRSAKLVCHCLLIESNQGLVLVDTGLGTGDLQRRGERLGRSFTLGVRPILREEETAIAQIRALGFDPGDVRHLILTHLDLDHAGGLSDFPKAQVHVFDVEYQAAMHPATFSERRRYRKSQWAHGPQWTIHGIQGQRWFDFDAVEAVAGCLLIPLPGHTRGHCAVAVPARENWLLHCGDAYFFRDEVASPPQSTPGLKIFQSLMQVDGRARHQNQRRLRELRRKHGAEVHPFCAHDAFEFERLLQTKTLQYHEPR